MISEKLSTGNQLIKLYKIENCKETTGHDETKAETALHETECKLATQQGVNVSETGASTTA